VVGRQDALGAQLGHGPLHGADAQAGQHGKSALAREGGLAMGRDGDEHQLLHAREAAQLKDFGRDGSRHPCVT
jgi:hypothetical protein